MNTVGSMLICIIQVTFVATAGILASFALRKWLRTSAGLPLLMTLLSIVFLSVCTFSPLPSWMEQFHGPLLGHLPTEFEQTDSPHPQPNSLHGTTTSKPGLFDTAALSRWFLEFQQMPLDDRDIAIQDSQTRILRPWQHAIGLVFVSFFVVGLFRFIGGLWGIRILTRSGRPLTEPALREQVDLIRAELGCRQAVQIRESPQLSLAATVGWWRPVVLLSGRWKTWSDEQLRSVLAHEIAHVARGDFLATVIAQLGLLLHYYHPFVHWMANRLRLEQELAADAMASQIVVGPQSYLRAISELALNQPTERVAWSVHTFLPTHRTFLRRVEMLRNLKSMSIHATRTSRWSTVFLAAVITSIAVGFRPADSDPVPPGFRDDFIDQYDDAWTVLNANTENVSLTKTPGMLTITTEPGGIWRHYDNVKNVFLIDTPMKSGNFVMTTRIVGFNPQANYQQAGLICFNDIDNYAKFGFEFDGGNGGRTLAVVPEVDGEDHENAILHVEGSVEDLWLRVVRYNEKYVFSSSRDGKNYKTIVIQKCDVDYPAKVGILAKNGNGSGSKAPAVDANFDLFEIVPLESRPELEKWVKRQIQF